MKEADRSRMLGSIVNSREFSSSGREGFDATMSIIENEVAQVPYSSWPESTRAMVRAACKELGLNEELLYGPTE